MFWGEKRSGKSCLRDVYERFFKLLYFASRDLEERCDNFFAALTTEKKIFPETLKSLVFQVNRFMG